jgi:hypothetical protein
MMLRNAGSHQVQPRRNAECSGNHPILLVRRMCRDGLGNIGSSIRASHEVSNKIQVFWINVSKSKNCVFKVPSNTERRHCRELSWKAMIDLEKSWLLVANGIILPEEVKCELNLFQRSLLRNNLFLTGKRHCQHHTGNLCNNGRIPRPFHWLG